MTYRGGGILKYVAPLVACAALLAGIAARASDNASQSPNVNAVAAAHPNDDLVLCQVSGENVNVRVAPHLNNTILTKVKGGTFIRAKRIQDDWCEMDWPADVPVWISKAAVQTYKADPKIGSIFSVRARVLAQAANNAQEVCSLKQRDRVAIIQETNDWYQIQPPASARAYISAKYVILDARPNADAAQIALHAEKPKALQNQNHAETFELPAAASAVRAASAKPSVSSVKTEAQQELAEVEVMQEEASWPKSTVSARYIEAPKNVSKAAPVESTALLNLALSKNAAAAQRKLDYETQVRAEIGRKNREDAEALQLAETKRKAALEEQARQAAEKKKLEDAESARLAEKKRQDDAEEAARAVALARRAVLDEQYEAAAEKKKALEADIARLEDARSKAEALERGRVAAEKKKLEDAEAAQLAIEDSRKKELELQSKMAAERKRLEDEVRAHAETVALKRVELDAQARAAAAKKKALEDELATLNAAKKKAEAEEQSRIASEKKRLQDAETARLNAESRKVEIDEQVQKAAEKKAGLEQELARLADARKKEVQDAEVRAATARKLAQDAEAALRATEARRKADLESLALAAAEKKKQEAADVAKAAADAKRKSELDDQVRAAQEKKKVYEGEIARLEAAKRKAEGDLATRQAAEMKHDSDAATARLAEQVKRDELDALARDAGERKRLSEIEAAKAAAARKLAEDEAARLAAERKNAAAEAARLAAERKQAQEESAKLALARKQAEEARAAAERKQQDADRIVAERKKAGDERLAAEKKLDDDRRTAAAAVAAAKKKQDEEAAARKLPEPGLANGSSQGITLKEGRPLVLDESDLAANGKEVPSEKNYAPDYIPLHIQELHNKYVMPKVAPDRASLLVTPADLPPAAAPVPATPAVAAAQEPKRDASPESSVHLIPSDQRNLVSDVGTLQRMANVPIDGVKYALLSNDIVLRYVIEPSDVDLTPFCGKLVSLTGYNMGRTSNYDISVIQMRNASTFG